VGAGCPNPNAETRQSTASDVSLAERFAFLFALVVLGFAARRYDVLTEARNAALGRLAFYVLLPALIFAPTAVSTYAYATELGGDATFASLNVFATTVAALGTLSAFLQLST